jgi:hypothetical protein
MKILAPNKKNIKASLRQDCFALVAEEEEKPSFPVE